MEKNILPVGLNSARPNIDLANQFGKDYMFQNVFFEAYKDAHTDTQQVFAIKRPGISSTAAASPSVSGTGLGVFAAQDFSANNIYFAVLQSGVPYIYHWNGVSTVTNLGAFISSANNYYKRIRFVNIGLPTDTANIAVTNNGSRISLIKGNSIVGTFAGSLSAPWSSSAVLTNPVYLNNRIFVGVISDISGLTVDGSILQSNLGFTSFSASEYVVVEAYGGRLVELARYNDYIVAFKEYSTEFFEDVANQNGSVLSRVGPALQQIGCTNPMTIVDTGGGEFIWLSIDEQKNHRIVKLNNSFNIQDITDSYIAKYLNLVNAYDGSYAYLLNANGHRFYVLTLKNSYTSSTNDLMNITFVYDLDTGLWTTWNTESSGTTFTANGFNYQTLGTWAVTGACRTSFNTTYVQDYNTGSLYQLDDAYYQDRGSNITVKLRFPNIDLGTFKRKFLNKITALVDTDAPAISTLYFRWGPLNLVTTGTTTNFGLRTVRASSTTPYEFTSVAFGTFKRGSFELTHTENTPFRLSALIFDYHVGDGYGVP